MRPGSDSTHYAHGFRWGFLLGLLVATVAFLFV